VGPRGILARVLVATIAGNLLVNLFAVDMPTDTQFNLVFAFHNEDLVGAHSSDGTVPLISQLPPRSPGGPIIGH
jgi:hypothetical protein